MLTTLDDGPVVLLFSGGLDSTVCAHLAGNRLVGLISFNYGQPAAASELLAGQRWAQRHGVRRWVVNLPLLGVDSAMRTGPGVAGPRLVPGRNFAMFAHALNFAASVGAHEVWFGANRDDSAEYPDCSPLFVNYVNLLARHAYGIGVMAPLLWRSKAEVVALARDIGVDVAATWSCYEPRGADPCGTCNACALRARALRPPCTRCSAGAGEDCHDASGYGADHPERRAGA